MSVNSALNPEPICIRIGSSCDVGRAAGSTEVVVDSQARFYLALRDPLTLSSSFKMPSFFGKDRLFSSPLILNVR